MISSANQTG